MSKIPQKGPGVGRGGGGLFWPFVWWLILNVAQNFKKYLRRNREKGEGGCIWVVKRKLLQVVGGRGHFVCWVGDKFWTLCQKSPPFPRKKKNHTDIKISSDFQLFYKGLPKTAEIFRIYSCLIHLSRILGPKWDKLWSWFNSSNSNKKWTVPLPFWRLHSLTYLGPLAVKKSWWTLWAPWAPPP